MEGWVKHALTSLFAEDNPISNAPTLGKRALSLESAPPITATNKHSIDFLFDKPFYLPGQRIQGQVQVNLEKDTTVRSLNLWFHGAEAVKIVVGSGKSRSTYTSNRDMTNSGV